MFWHSSGRAEHHASSETPAKWITPANDSDLMTPPMVLGLAAEPRWYVTLEGRSAGRGAMSRMWTS